MLMVTAHSNHRGHLGAVVAGENHQGVVGDVKFLQGAEQLTDNPVHFVKEVTVRSR